MENQLSIVLSKNKLLENVDISKIDFNKIKGKLLTIGEGQLVFREGDGADNIYMVISGEINVVKKRLLGKTKSYLFSDNDFFGHEEYFEEVSRVSTAVALRDSYLVNLSRQEIDYLIECDDQVYVNLRQPVAEIEEEDFNQETISKPAEVENPDIKRKTFDDFPFNKNEKKEQADEEFFKSIADASIIDEQNIVQNLEEQEPTTTGKEDISFSENDFLNEDGIPKAEVDLTSEEDSKGTQSPESNIQLNEELSLDFNNFEKPEEKLSNESFSFKTEETKPINDLEDILFQMLNGQEEQNIDKKENTAEQVAANDDDFFSALSQTVPETTEPIVANVENFEPPILETPKEILKPESDHVLNAEQKNIEIIENNISVPKPTLNDFEAEEILAEADKKIEQIEEQKIINKDKSKNDDYFDEAEAMKSEQLQLIVRAAQLVNSTIRIDEVLKTIVEVATDLTDADRGTLYLIDREKSELWSLVAMGTEVKEIRLKIGDGFAGSVARTGEILNIKDVRKDLRFRADVDKSTGYETLNTLTFPIKNNKEEIIGVLQLLNSKNGEFSKHDEELLNAMSIHAALALQNAEMVEKLLQVERVQSLGKMANFLIQDIKKPILVSKRYAEHLKNKNLTPDNTQIVDMLLEQLNHIADIVQTTSSYSEGKTILRTLNVSLNKTLDDYKGRINTYVETRNCKIVEEYDKDVTVKLDLKEFYQCYMHIVKNACDAMPDGGTITISTKREDKEKKVKILLRDNGLGIAESLKDKIFEPFFTQGKKEGTGLGLSITKKIVEAHNGSIEVLSSLGEGSTFSISLPIISAF